MEGYKVSSTNAAQSSDLNLHQNLNSIFPVAFNWELQWRWIEQGFPGDGMTKTLK
jgi:hypothetical protein